MKICASCHEDLPKDKFSKKQWKLEKRRCKVCTADNREVQPLPPSSPTKNNIGSANDDESNDGGIDRLLESMNISDNEMIPVSDEELFKQPPQKEDCPICFITMPSFHSGHKYKSCCGKEICSGCVHASVSLMDDDQLCPFCRAQAPNEEERIERFTKRVEMNDPKAIFNLGCDYDQGTFGYSQNRNKAIELWHRAGKLGFAESYHNIGNAYLHGDGVERDMRKAQHYWELAAMGGDAMARYNLGVYEKQDGNMVRSLKHFMISIEGGFSDPLTKIKELYTKGHVTKDDYARALRARQSYLDEIRSDQRDRAAAFTERYKYY